MENFNIDKELREELIFGALEDLPRPYQMARRYALGETLQDIGDEFGLTRERIRQIINNETPWTTTYIMQARKEQLERFKEEERMAVQEWSLNNVGASIAEAAEDLAMDEELVYAYLGRLRDRHTTVEKQGPTRCPDENLLLYLQLFYEETGKSTATAYSQWAKNNKVPGHQTVSIRFGSWNEAVTRAGIKKVAPVGRDRRYSTEDLWAAVLDVLRHDCFTAASAEQWLSKVVGAPSLALIRQRLAWKWKDIRLEAMKILRGTSAHDPDWIRRVSEPRNWETFLVEEDPTEHVHDALTALGPRLTMQGYNAWAQVEGRPAAMTLCRRAGLLWADLVAQAGGATVHRKVKVTEEEIFTWLRRFLDSGEGHSYLDYESWRKGTSAPSTSTITMRYRSWQQACDAARQAPLSTAPDTSDTAQVAHGQIAS